MPYTDDYRELIETAHDAIDELLNASKHDSWMRLRLAYGEMSDALELDEAKREKAEKRDAEAAERRAAVARRQEIRERWTKLPAARREGILLDVLGDERLFHRDLCDRVNTALVGAPDEECAVYPTEVQVLAKSMFDAGQLDRAVDPTSRRRRYVYFRKRGLDGPIADLDRAYRDD